MIWRQSVRQKSGWQGLKTGVSRGDKEKPDKSGHSRAVDGNGVDVRQCKHGAGKGKKACDKK